MNTNNIWKTIKLIGKSIIGALCAFRIDQNPILIFSTRRSGSTLLMRMIHSQPGVDYVDEPLNLWRLHPHFHRLPHPPYGKFTSITGEDERRLEAYIRDLLTGRVRLRHRGNLLDPGRTFLVRRLVVKDINATPLIDWFHRRFDADIVYLLRHPCAVADSLLRRGWPDIAAPYLNDEAYCEAHLDPDLRTYARKILERGTPLQRYVLEWCLDNRVPLRLYRERPWLVLTYEELILRSDEMARLLCSRLDLPSPERMARVVQAPSRTTTPESRRVIRTQGASALIARWTKRLNADELRRAQEVLDAFEVEVYQAESPFPAPKMCHFRSLDEHEELRMQEKI